ncbi:hypothetical protein FTUN_6199 [Frigoriglobus tundricola]|uniref:Uncharacterized protein n=1 Tax=Frigoriglobus tundricola TaxID=2774151 RepID=A0A6M5YYJ0_9BACT|nr:hypothetical protein FTUN_6199 [Frigoriglobus tundricola]
MLASTAPFASLAEPRIGSPGRSAFICLAGQPNTWERTGNPSS